MMIHPSTTSNIPRVDEDKCRVCATCKARAACRTKAMMALDPGEAPFIDSNRCYGCRVCIPTCPFEAVVL